MKRSLRAFIAVDVSPIVIAAAGRLITRWSQTSAKVRWVETHNLHLTLKFLGEIEQTLVPEVCRVIARSVAHVPSFDLMIRGAGAFPDPRRPRTLWLGVTTGAAPLIDLHTALDKELGELGIRGEGRAFRPHLTIGRVRKFEPDLAELIERDRDYEAGISSVDEVVLYSSELERDGPLHHELCTVELKV